MKFKLVSKDWKELTEVEVPDDSLPDIINWNDKLFYWADRDGVFVEADVFKAKE